MDHQESITVQTEMPALQAMKRKKMLADYVAGNISKEEWLQFEEQYLLLMKQRSQEAWEKAQNPQYAF